MTQEQLNVAQEANVVTTDEEALPPMGFEIIKREFLRDKVAMTALIILMAILIAAFISPFIFDVNEVTRVDIFSRFAAPGEKGYLLGADEGGRDIFALLFLGTRNSVLIGFSVTIITAITGIMLGIISGYYGGIIDDIMMRVVDFIMVLPQFMIIIVIVTIVGRFNAWTLIWIISLFGWAGITRLFRTATLSEASKDYIAAGKTMGTRDPVIMFGGLLPNLSSLIITDLTLAFAGNIGLETGLSFLGFGLPAGTPSLGTLISYANNPDVIENKMWVWLPAVIVILVLMLCINYIGQALQRAADSRQRIG
ncbi:ABC transporter permease [Ignavigranum ruoffiae]|uniref:ABC transporter permease n=1 Tax=Ignavigranum ruoffiae TaxID=89093 RepID=UPI0024AD5B98|nr:ABC transporter permease [Ignavigranum ruoffiae]